MSYTSIWNIHTQHVFTQLRLPWHIGSHTHETCLFLDNEAVDPSHVTWEQATPGVPWGRRHIQSNSLGTATRVLENFAPTSPQDHPFRSSCSCLTFGSCRLHVMEYNKRVSTTLQPITLALTKPCTTNNNACANHSFLRSINVWNH